jgi:hypothetical protein
LRFEILLLADQFFVALANRCRLGNERRNRLSQPGAFLLADFDFLFERRWRPSRLSYFSIAALSFTIAATASSRCRTSSSF